MTRKRNKTRDSSVVDAALAKRMEELAEDETVRVLIKMRTKTSNIESRSMDSVVKQLKRDARLAQKPIQEYLQGKMRTRSIEGQDSERVQQLQSFWLVNMVGAEVTKAQIADLAKRSGVVKIVENRTFHVYPSETIEPDEPVWDNVAFIQAPEVWALGYRGQNVKVAVMDTGVDLNHPELVGAMGGEPPYYEGYWVEFDENGNPVSGSTPHDTDTHGTHVSGTAVGRNVNVQIGVAPGAILGHILALPQGSGTTAQLLAGMQWAVDHGFAVVNGSWGGSGLDEEFAEAVANLKAAGVFPVFAIGNDGPGETGAPGNTPSALAVGALNAKGEIAEFSGGGIVQYPNYTYPDPSDQIKPDIAAPGVAITSAVPGGGYEAYSGTSMASPHMAGAVALLLSKNPDLSVEEIETILRESVGGMVGLLNDPGSPGKDPRYGWGRFNALQAIQQVKAPDFSGTIQGYLQGENEFIAGGTVVLDGPEKRILTTDHHGFFEGLITEGEYRVTAQAMAYLPDNTVCPIAAEEKSIRNIVLKAAPLGFIEGTVEDSVTKNGLDEVQVNIPGTTVITRTEENGRFAMALKEGKYQINFSLEGYYAATLRNVVVRPDDTTEANIEMTFGRKTFRGSVKDFETDLPLAYTFIQVLENGNIALADANGEFTLDLPAGSYTLKVQRVGYWPLEETVMMPHGQISRGEFVLKQQPGEFLLESHFDTPDDWAQWETENGWHLTGRRFVTPGMSVWNGDEATGEYPNLQNITVRHKTSLTVPEKGTTTLSFHLWGQLERNYDYFYVTVWQGEQRDEIYRYTNLLDQWQNVSLDLTPYAGTEIVIAFEFTSDYSVTSQGVFIDDVSVFHSEE